MSSLLTLEGTYVRIIVFIDILDVEIICSEVKYVTLIVGPDIFGVFESFQYVLPQPDQGLQVGRFVRLRLPRICLLINLCH